MEGIKDYLIIWMGKERVIALLSFKKLESIISPTDSGFTGFIWLPSIRLKASIKNQIKIQDKTIPVGESYRRSFREIINKKSLN